eukprot:2286561-Alexandrium_andersonii.AAC.1
MCVFGDIKTCVPADLMCEMEGLSGQALRTFVKTKFKVAPTCFCVRHQKQCPIVRAHLTSAGSPCQDHSSFGKNQQMDGPKAVFFMIWTGMR